MSATRKRTARAGVAVLVAADVDGRFMPSHRSDCVDGEVCWVLPPCADGDDGVGCDCHEEFQGTATGGRTTTARVSTLRGVTRGEALRVLRDASTPTLGAVAAAQVATATLDAAMSFPTGSFVVREGGRPVLAFCEHHQAEVARAALRRDHGHR